jgi:hypothetical protein
MTAQIRERLQSFREEALSQSSRDDDLDFGSTSEQIADLVSASSGLQNALDKVSELSEPTKILAALIGLIYALLPVRRLMVSGVIDPPRIESPSRSSASATLSIESGAKLVAAVTVRRPLNDAKKVSSGDYMGLVDPAAVWVQFEITRALINNKVGLSEPESYARAREGVDRRFEWDAVGARAAFDSALKLDPRNWAAAIDLAVTEARITGNYGRAIDVLTRAFDDICRAPEPAGFARGLWQRRPRWMLRR